MKEVAKKRGITYNKEVAQEMGGKSRGKKNGKEVNKGVNTVLKSSGRRSTRKYCK